MTATDLSTEYNLLHALFLEYDIFLTKHNEQNELSGQRFELEFEIPTSDIAKWKNYFTWVMGKCRSKKLQVTFKEKDKNTSACLVYHDLDLIDDTSLKSSIYFLIEGLEQKHHTVAPSVEHFSFLYKPTHLCQMNCSYCYDEFYRKTISTRGSKEDFHLILEKLSQFAKKIQLIYHGGEALLMGKEWFHMLYREIFPRFPMIQFKFSIMSNGVDFDEEWFELFKKYNISIGTSYNAYFQSELRAQSNESSDYYEIDKLIDISKKTNVQFGLIDVITSKNYEYIIEIYEYYKSKKLNPCFNIVFDANNTSETNLLLTPTTFVEKWMEYFKYWFYDTNGLYERSAYEALGFAIGFTEATCANQDCRGSWVTMNAVGDLYPCDRYYTHKYKMGNIREIEVSEDFLFSNGYQTYYNETETRFENHCFKCNYFESCKGGCNANALQVSNNEHLMDVDENHCEIFKLKYDAIYDFLRDVDVYDATINPYARALIFKYGFYTVKEIKDIAQIYRKDIYFEYDLDNLFECSEYLIFKNINKSHQFDHAVTKHCDVYIPINVQSMPYNYEYMRKNQMARNKSLHNYLKKTALMYLKSNK